MQTVQKEPKVFILPFDNLKEIQTYIQDLIWDYISDNISFYEISERHNGKITQYVQDLVQVVDCNHKDIPIYRISAITLAYVATFITAKIVLFAPDCKREMDFTIFL
jgi:hypothetical protein